MPTLIFHFLGCFKKVFDVCKRSLKIIHCDDTIPCCLRLKQNHLAFIAQNNTNVFLYVVSKNSILKIARIDSAFSLYCQNYRNELEFVLVMLGSSIHSARALLA